MLFPLREISDLGYYRNFGEAARFGRNHSLGRIWPRLHFSQGIPGLGRVFQKGIQESSKDETGGYELDIGVAKEFKALVGFLGLGEVEEEVVDDLA